MVTSKALKTSDIHELNRKDEEFARMFAYIRALNCPVYPADHASYPLYRALDVAYWKATDVYLYRSTSHKGKLSKHDIYHPAIHHMLVNAFVKHTEEMPLFTLLCETIATSTEFYFVLRDLSSGHAKSTEKEALQRYISGQMVKSPSLAKARKEALRKIQAGSADPFAAFKKSVQSGFAIYQELLDYTDRRIAGQPFDPHEATKFLKRRDCDFVILSYNFAGNILYVKSYCGASSEIDRETVSACLALLENSESFMAFVEALLVLGARNGEPVQFAA